MATKYIDVVVKPVMEGILSSDTSTVTNKVRVAWDTGVTREELHVTLKTLADKVLDTSVVIS